ncbi:calexcitin-2 isoform X2 [Lingula anatina]|uniref:Calexcitin-2 isoform X2 n=1 Tax=Lingula anatina TaxID=7574 RepID=A0A1S3J749_LINAN|nr:calexcitin-2 isoform X2 [Lingula anatina]|eukprot:XP_013406225.1 calexcitin-2 isoform X2 [Lingula anatina]
MNDNLLSKEKKTIYLPNNVNKDGCLEWRDFEQAREKICKMSGWEPGSEKFDKTKNLFVDIWRKLQDCADENCDNKISADEWVKMWASYIKHHSDPGEVAKVPDWVEEYVEYKFNLFDRTADGIIDIEEFEYVLGYFGISPPAAKSAFIIISQNMERRIDLPYYKQLVAEYYRSDDPGALGTFINGKLDFCDGLEDAQIRNDKNHRDNQQQHSHSQQQQQKQKNQEQKHAATPTSNG